MYTAPPASVNTMQHGRCRLYTGGGRACAGEWASSNDPTWLTVFLRTCINHTARLVPHKMKKTHQMVFPPSQLHAVNQRRCLSNVNVLWSLFWTTTNHTQSESGLALCPRFLRTRSACGRAVLPRLVVDREHESFVGDTDRSIRRLIVVHAPIVVRLSVTYDRI